LQDLVTGNRGFCSERGMTMFSRARLQDLVTGNRGFCSPDGHTLALGAEELQDLVTGNRGFCGLRSVANWQQILVARPGARAGWVHWFRQGWEIDAYPCCRIWRAGGVSAMGFGLRFDTN
jgi:hypothetical protein